MKLHRACSSHTVTLVKRERYSAAVAAALVKRERYSAAVAAALAGPRLELLLCYCRALLLQFCATAAALLPPVRVLRVLQHC